MEGKHIADANAATIEALRLNLAQSTPVLTEYPVLDAAKAGLTFWYKGNLWSYMTQVEIDMVGWNVAVGFPAPVNKNWNPKILFDGMKLVATDRLIPSGNGYIDFIGMGVLELVKSVYLNQISSAHTIIGFRNATLLTNLENIGTASALVIGSRGMTAEVINQLFTQLPITIKTATIDVTSNPGTATCTPSIATAKGYIVKTA